MERLANFIRNNVISWFSIPKRILSDNGIPFVNAHVRQLLEQYGVDHIKSSLYYPQENSQAEASRKTLLRMLSTMVYKEPKRWTNFLPLVLWHITSRRALPLKPYLSLYYMEPRQWFLSRLWSRQHDYPKLSDSHYHISYIEALDERRHNKENR